MRDNVLTVTLARVFGLPIRLFTRRSFTPPQKALILKPGWLSQVMLATPLLAALSEAYPRAQFDWAVGPWARPAVATNPRLSELIDTGRVGTPEATWRDVRGLVARLRAQEYDTCFIPSRSSLLALIPWLAGIPQRVGLDVHGRGFAHTLPVKAPAGERHTAAVYLAIAQALGIESRPQMEFFPPDTDRATVTQLLVDEVDWLGEVPLVVMHPGGGHNPSRPDERKRWPVERFALLANYLVRERRARVLLVGAEADRPVAGAVAGLMSATAVNLAGRFTLGQVGALCEMAGLYVGNDTGPTHVAAAVGCPTLAIFGPSDPALSGPYATKGRVLALWHEDGAGAASPFSWEDYIRPEEAMAAAERLLAGDGSRPGEG